MFILFLVMFLILIFFPFWLRFRIKYDDGKETSLIVRNDNVKDPRYFAKSFKQKLKVAEQEGNNYFLLHLSKAEEVFVSKDGKDIPKTVDKLAYLTEETETASGTVFKKEVYAVDNIIFGEKNKLRAAAGEKNVFLGEKTSVCRWIDAEGQLIIKKFCHIGKTATSAERLVIEPQVDFDRLYAPIIEVKKYVELIDSPRDEIIVNRIAPVYKKVKRGIEEVEEKTEFRGTIITDNYIKIGAGSIVYGDVKSESTVHIMKNAIVTGNVFADDAVILEEGAKVFGNVFATEDIYIGPKAEVGIIGRTKSAVSRSNMVIAEGAVIYGYVGTENFGRTIEKDDFIDEVVKCEGIRIKPSDAEPFRDFDLITCKLDENGYVYFDDLKEYEEIDYYGFRDNDKLKGIIIPDGAKEINPSMFFGCDRLEYVKIPASVKEIGEYAFYSCTELKKIEFDEDTCLDSIGDYAFSECVSLEKMQLPKIGKVENAVFRNNINLTEILVKENENGTECSKHAFQNCDKLGNNGLLKYIVE